MERAAGTVGIYEHHAHERHRDVGGGAARAAVFGVSDGLVTNVSLILGFAGAHPSAGIVRLSGLAGLVAGACSMALGEYVSMQAQRELLQRELATERHSIERFPDEERAELAHLYEDRGLDSALSEQLATAMMRDADSALRAHAREELGLSLDSLGSPVAAGASSFLSFAFGALVPLLPWLLVGGGTATVATLACSALLAGVIGVALAHFTGKSALRSGARQLVLSAAAAAIAYGVGVIVGAMGPT